MHFKVSTGFDVVEAAFEEIGIILEGAGEYPSVDVVKLVVIVPVGLGILDVKLEVRGNPK